MRYLFYVSGHGLGHATRVAAIIHALQQADQDAHILVRSRAPADRFANTAIAHESAAIDAGMIENGLCRQDIKGTLEVNLAVAANRLELLAEEAETVARFRPDVIAADIPPLAARIGEAAGVDCLAISNFSWDEIYAPFIQSYPDFAPLVATMRDDYARTTSLLRLPFHMPMGAFPRREDVPLVVRPADVPKREIMELFELEEDTRLLFVTFRTAENQLPPPVLPPGWTLLTTIPALGGINAKRLRQCSPSLFPSVVAASDMVLSKVGYGIVSECVAGKTRLLYLPRYDFAEVPVLAGESRNHIPAAMMPEEDFLSGNWAPHIQALAQRPFPESRLDVNGAEVVARKLVEHANRRCGRCGL